ncbi:uncharacterized protein LOC108027115 [Drosophila biarmipes]|uniref:uncharacterized protein LOC108027115 n=1 Tax=Drosophila biarmipes TaxID=125945 RepID=UPI0007E6396D|nr:uncharacterized protein LOC108027115 [Drosophila biarmipes]
MPGSMMGSVGSNTSVADVLRGRNIPVSRPSQKLVARTQGDAQKVEHYLTKVKSYSQISLGGLSSRYESKCLSELDEWCTPRTAFRDHADVSLHPSYDMKQFHYDLSCLVRYLDAKEEYNQQLLREMDHLIVSQRNICDQFFLRNILCYKTRWPPLHTKQELKIFVSKFFQLTPKQKRRVDHLLKSNLGPFC